MGDREEALIQKAKEVREGLIEMAKQEIDASHIEVGVITAVDAGNSLVVIMIGGTNRLVPFTGHDVSEFVVGEYWAVIFDDDYGTIRLGWWVSAAGGGGVRPVTPHKDTHKSGGVDAFVAADLLEAHVKRLLESGGPTTLLMGVVADGQYLKRAGAGIVGIEGPVGGGLQAIFWHLDGALAIGTEIGEARVLPQDMTFVKAYIYCKTTGTAGSTIADIHKNGVTIYTAQANRPTLAWNDPDKKAVTVAPDVTAGLEGDIMTIDIDAIATGAEDLVIVLIFVGPVGGFPYGSCYGNHIAWVQAAAVQNTWYNISDADIADGELNGVVHDGSGKLTVTEPGDYLVLYSLCYEDDIAKDHLEAGIELNGSGAAEPAGQTHSENKFANEMEHLGGGTILSLAAGDTIEVAIRTVDAGAPDITIIAMNLSVCRVGVGGWPGTIEIQEDDAKVADADIVNFEGGGGKVVDEGGGKVTVDITGGIPAADFTIWEPGAPPVAPSALDDEFENAAFDAVLWTEFDPGAVQTISEVEAGLLLDNVTGVDAIAGIFQAIPSGDFTIITRVSVLGPEVGNTQGGIILWQDPTNVNGDLYTHSLFFAAAVAEYITVQKWNSYLTWTANLKLFTDIAIGTHAYLRVRRTSTTYYFDWSTDGIGWYRIYTGALDFVPSHFGLFENNTNPGMTTRCRFGFFRYKDSDVGITGIMEGDRIDGWRA